MASSPDSTEFRLLRELVAERRVQWHHHALQRIFERGISRGKALRTMEHGEIIEQYHHREPLPSCLIFRVEEQPLHVVLPWTGNRVCATL